MNVTVTYTVFLVVFFSSYVDLIYMHATIGVKGIGYRKKQAHSIKPSSIYIAHVASRHVRAHCKKKKTCSRDASRAIFCELGLSVHILY